MKLSIVIISGIVALSILLLQESIYFYQRAVYVKTIHRERLERLAAGLKQTYAETGNWERVRNDPALRAKLLRDTLYLKKRAAGNRDDVGYHPLPYGPNGRLFDENVLLLDNSHMLVFGPSAARLTSDAIPIVYGGKEVGCLGMLPVRSIRSDRFVSQQLQMVFISLSVFLLSALILVPLANRILRPVKKLTTALYDLATGQYGTRVEVKAGYELGKLVDDFNCLALALEKNRQERFQYAADVSHELLTPLSTLRAEIEAILEGVHQATADSVGSLHNKVMQLSRLVDDLYQSSLADVGMISYHPEIQPIADILVKSLNSFRIDYAIKGIELQIDMPAPNDYTVYADGNRLRQLFDNLLKNSVKYTSPGGMLMIRMECRDNVIAIDFQDSDPGVPPSDLVRIFDRQFRGSKSGDKAGGAGLGLAICKSIVEVHGGSIRAHSSPLGGLWIRIEMPIMGG